MSQPTPLSGFPELLPAQRYVEQQVLARLAQTFELHGFASVETRAVEPVEQLLRKGETSKEIYVLAPASTTRTATRVVSLGLHFDLTVPFARYVLENAGKLEFPFRRYQIQKVWRGERPQEGRFREFTQADIDVIGRDTLAFHHDVEVARVMLDALRGARLPARVPAPGEQPQADPGLLHRPRGHRPRGGDACRRQARQDVRGGRGRHARRGRRTHPRAGRQCLALARISTTDTSFVEQVRALGVRHELLEQGLAELAAVIEGCAPLVTDRVEIVADLKIARGLDYYTGTVFETRLIGYESLGSICSGGRYDALATDGRTTYPGVGISLGVSRVLVPLLSKGVVEADRSVPSAVLVAVVEEESRIESDTLAEQLRGNGVACEVAPSAAEVRQADPARRAARHSLRPLPRRGRGGPRDQGHPQRRADRSGPHHVDAAGRGPAPARPTQPTGATVIRTHDAGSLRPAHVDAEVTLAGWVARRRDHGGVAFIDLREASGVVQVVIRDEAVAHNLRSEYCLKVTGTVSLRPEGNQNPNLPTGEIEVIATDVVVLSPAAPLPFPIDDAASFGGGSVGEEARLRHRYLDLRRSGPNAAMRLRSKVNKAAREVLDTHGFVEVETPTLTRSTPEGARDFLVPARLQPGSWYALPQSPQLFKQLLMVAGLERYYQIARCYRDEDFRADRQPEFTQLDVEMSFVEQDDVIALTEEILTAVWALIGYDVPTPLPRLTYAEAMARFGTDKPDLRLGLELVECQEFFKDTPFRVFQSEYVGAVVMPGGAGQPRKQLDAWQEWAKQRGARGLAYLLVKEDGELTGPVAKNISDEERAGIAAHVGAQPGDCIFFAAGAAKSSRALLGAARLEIGRRGGLIDEDAWSFVWVVDAPLFEPAAEATAAG